MLKNIRTNTNCNKNHKMPPSQRIRRPPSKRKCPTIESIPLQILETIFSYIKLRDIRACTLVCKSWNNIMSDENSEVWRAQCYRKIPEELIKSPLLRSVQTYKAKVRALCHAWNPYDCSRNIYVKANGFTLHRNPVAQSTDACRSKVGFREGRHAWEVTWEGPLGTVAVVGISTKEAALQCSGYMPLIGSDNQSWGWNLVDNSLLYNGTTKGIFPEVSNPQRSMPVQKPVCHPNRRLLTAAEQIGERITVVLDCENKTLSFERDFQFLGVAFKGLPNKKFYPTVSAVYGNTEVSMVYLGYPFDG